MKSPFYYLRYYLILSGIIEIPNVRWPYNNIITVISCLGVFNLGLGGLLYMLTDSAPFFDKMEAFLIFVCDVHLLSKVIVLPLNRKKLLWLMGMLEEMSKESYNYGKFDVIHKRDLWYSRRTAESVIVSFTILHSIATFVSILHHVLVGSNSPPFQIYTPFDNERNFYWVCVYSIIISVWPVIDLSTAMAILVTLIINTSTQMSYLIKRLEALGEDGSEEDVKKCIALHAKILTLVDGINDLLSSLLFIEYLMSSMQCCFGGYRFFMGKEDLSSKLLSASILFMSAAVPCVNCLSGQIIKNQGEKIFTSAYDNSWYRLSMKGQKMLKVLLLMSSKPLTFNYRNLLIFDMVLFGVILKGAYSLITALQTIGTN